MPDKRLTSDWLSAYMELTSDLESPDSIHLWTGLTVMSAAVQRNVSLRMKYGTIYPNLYVIIVAQSGKVRKSAAMDYGRELLIETFPALRIMRDSMTAQGLIKALNHKVQVVNGNEIREELRSDVAIFADEVANLFGYDKTRASQMVIFLTRAYTCPGVYDHTTVRDATVRLHNLYPVLLGGTDPRNLKVLPDDAVGGLTGRLIWVIENARRNNDSGWLDPKADVKKQLLREYVMHDLLRIANLKGSPEVKPEARALYDHWYNELAKRDEHDPDTDAFYQRCHVTALRLAILLSLSNSDEMVIKERHVKGAIELIEAQLPEMKRVTMYQGGSQYEQQRAKLLHFLQGCQMGVSTWERALKHMGMPHDEFERVVETLKKDGSLEAFNQKLGGRTLILIKLTAQGMGTKIEPQVEGP